MQNDRTRADASATPRRVLVGEAAELLGISEDAVRMRVERGTLDSTREGRRLYVLLHGNPTGEPTRPHDRTNELIATLREQLEAELRFVRGGTDGSRLSERGIPTPNIFTGGYDFHSRHEWTCVADMGRPSRRSST